ncbi:MAG: thioesterase family protein [Acidimicrobiia bacterium]
MTAEPTACYVPTGEVGPHGGDLVESTRLSAAEWYSDGQHGGVVSALMARAIEQTPSLTDMAIARLTVELFRVVPVTTLEVVVEVVREGKRIQTTEVRLFDGGTELARALGQRLRVTDLDLPEAAGEPPHYPDDAKHFTEVMPFRSDGPITFGRRGVGIQEVEGSFRAPGPATTWLTMLVPLVDGEETTGTQRAIVLGDFVNGMSRVAQPNEWVFMNSDLSVNLAREPVGDWVGVAADSVWQRTGRGIATGRLYDRGGEVGRATQTVFLDQAAR